jgi:hypothetical protein
MFAVLCVSVIPNVEYISVGNYTIAILRPLVLTSPCRLLPLIVHPLLTDGKWDSKMSNTNERSMVHSEYHHLCYLYSDAALLLLLFMLSIGKINSRKANVRDDRAAVWCQ